MSHAETALRPVVGWAPVLEQPVSLCRRFGGVRAGHLVEGVLALPQRHSEAGRIAVAHGYTANVVSGPDGEYERNRHQNAGALTRLYTTVRYRVFPLGLVGGLAAPPSRDSDSHPSIRTHGYEARLNMRDTSSFPGMNPYEWRPLAGERDDVELHVRVDWMPSVEAGRPNVLRSTPSQTTRAHSSCREILTYGKHT